MGIGTAIAGFFEGAWQDLEAKHGAEIPSFILNLATGLAMVYLTRSDLTGAQKLAEVKNIILAVLETKGVAIAEDELNFLTELALRKIRSLLPQPQKP